MATLRTLADRELLDTAFKAIDFPQETWEEYQKRVRRSVGALHQRGIMVPDHDIDRVLMKTGYVMDAPISEHGESGRISYFRRRLRESMLVQDQLGGDTVENSRGVDILLELSSAR